MAQVRIIFNEGESNEYIFPLVYHVNDPEPAIKSAVIEGTRGDGSIVIPSGKKSIRIVVKGKIVDEEGYVNITAKMNIMRTKVTTALSTLKLQRFIGGDTWSNDWSFNVVRISEISFGESLRTSSQSYSVEFLVVSY